MKNVVFVLAVAACAGCRSDGGFGRADRAHGLEFASGCVMDRTNYNARRTMYLLRSAPGALADSCENSVNELERTYRLYLDPHDTH